jgi:hypothetical protein
VVGVVHVGASSVSGIGAVGCDDAEGICWNMEH